MDGIPAHAEMFNLSEFITLKEGPISKYLPGRRLPNVREFFCPACGLENPEPMHNKNSGCTRCDLKWMAIGNAFAVWKDRD